MKPDVSTRTRVCFASFRCVFHCKTCIQANRKCFYQPRVCQANIRTRSRAILFPCAPFDFIVAIHYLFTSQHDHNFKKRQTAHIASDINLTYRCFGVTNACPWANPNLTWRYWCYSGKLHTLHCRCTITIVYIWMLYEIMLQDGYNPPWTLIRLKTRPTLTTFSLFEP